MSEELHWRVTWTDPDGEAQVYDSGQVDVDGERDALHRARALLERSIVPTDVVILSRVVTRTEGPWTSQRVDMTVVKPALERATRTSRLIPSAFGESSLIRTMHDGSQEYGPYPSVDTSQS